MRPGDALASNMTASDTSTLTIKGNEEFVVGDILRIKDGGNDEWMTVTSIASKPTYSVTRDMGGVYASGSNPAWEKGTAIVNYGVSGEGGVLLTSSLSDAPYISIFTHAGNPWTTVNERGRFGNLNGYLGYSSDIYGMGIGSIDTGEANLTFDPTEGIRVRQGTDNLLMFDMAGNAKISNFYIDATDGLYAGTGNTRIQFDPGTGIWCGATDFIDAPFRVNTAGEMWASDANISGTLTVSKLHIPDEDITANSFHTNDYGDSWWGCTETNFNSDNDNALAYILRTGCVKFQSAIIYGALTTGDGSSINGIYIESLSIEADAIGENIITANKIENLTITANEIADNTIIAKNIAIATISGTNIKNGTIVGGNIADVTIAGSNLINSTITSGKIGSSEVKTINIDSNAVTGGNIALSTITTGNLVNETIQAGKIENLTITAAQIANLTITGGSGGKIAGSTITEDNIVADTITASSIAGNTITASEIASNTITANELVVGTVTANEITVTSLSSLTANMGSITAGSIVIGSTNKIWLNDGADGALNIGGSTKTSAPFRVSSTGTLIATGATIGSGSAYTGNSISTSYTAAKCTVANADKTSTHTAANASAYTGATIATTYTAAKCPTADADKTSTHTANNTSNVGTCPASTVQGWRYGSTTYINGGDVYTNTVTATQINGGGFGTLTITSGKLAINTTDALEIQASGNIKVLSGGDIQMAADDSSPSLIIFKPSVCDINMGCGNFHPHLCFYPSTSNSGRFNIGFNTADTSKPFGSIYGKTYNSFKLEVNRTSPTRTGEVYGTYDEVILSHYNGSYGTSSVELQAANNRIRLITPSGGYVGPYTSGTSTNLGTASYYWNDVSYKTLTDRGCLGWFDAGVEMQNGSIVSDINAIKAIRKHPTKKTVYGVPMLDYKSMPKCVYKPADEMGKILPRDEDDNPYLIEINEKGEEEKVIASDGAETTALLSIMLGAIKELSVEIENLNAKINN